MMRRLSPAIWPAICPVICCAAICVVGFSSAAAAQATPSTDRSESASRQVPARPGKAVEAQVSEASRKRSAREAQRARAQLRSAFPRTDVLLQYLAKRDQRALDAVLAHGRKIARRQASSAMALAREHHPELARLIAKLRGRAPRAHDAAIRDLVASMQRIERAKKRGEKDHQLALRVWSLESKARLLAARMSVARPRPGASPDLSRELAAILTQAEKAKRQQLRLEMARHERVIRRLRRRLEQDADKSIQSQLRRIQRDARKRTKSQKSDRRRK